MLQHRGEERADTEGRFERAGDDEIMVEGLVDPGAQELVVVGHQLAGAEVREVQFSDRAPKRISARRVGAPQGHRLHPVRIEPLKLAEDVGMEFRDVAGAYLSRHHDVHLLCRHV